MIKYILCFFFGHVKYEPQILKISGRKDIITLYDILGEKLVSINVCKRCGAVYSDLLK